MSQRPNHIARSHRPWQKLSLCILLGLCMAIASPLPAAANTPDTNLLTLTTQKASATKKSIKKAKVSKVSAKAYTGKKITPKPTVKIGKKKLKRGRDYTLSYKNNKSVGTATIVIKGKGKYKGKKKVTFKIYQAATVVEDVEIDESSDASNTKSSSGSHTQPQQSNTVYATKTGECYHRDGCSSLSRSKIPLSRSDAVKRGLRPCNRCKP